MKVEIYGASWCNPCKAAKLVCEDNGYDYEFFDIQENPDKRKEIEDKLGRTIDSIPQIFVDDKYIGQSREFFEFIKTL